MLKKIFFLKIVDLYTKMCIVKFLDTYRLF